MSENSRWGVAVVQWQIVDSSRSMSWGYLLRATLVVIASPDLTAGPMGHSLRDPVLVEIFEIRARATLIYPQVWSAEGTRYKPSVAHEAHSSDRSWTGKNVGLPIKRALKPVQDVAYGSDRDCG